MDEQKKPATIQKVELSAKVIRRDGTVEDLGTVAKSHPSFWDRLRGGMGQITMTPGEQ